MTDDLQPRIIAALAATLELGDRASAFDADTQLFGALPELDSIGVLELIAVLEDEFGITVEADDVTDERFATVGTLTGLIRERLG